mgnify:CR=1 FL=1
MQRCMMTFVLLLLAATAQAQEADVEVRVKPGVDVTIRVVAEETTDELKTVAPSSTGMTCQEAQAKIDAINAMSCREVGHFSDLGRFESAWIDAYTATATLLDCRWSQDANELIGPRMDRASTSEAAWIVTTYATMSGVVSELQVGLATPEYTLGAHGAGVELTNNPDKVDESCRRMHMAALLVLPHTRDRYNAAIARLPEHTRFPLWEP